MNMYAIERFWGIYGPMALQFSATQPWLIGYNGETSWPSLGTLVFTRLWIDQELKDRSQ